MRMQAGIFRIPKPFFLLVSQAGTGAKNRHPDVFWWRS
jgi:hypothetical protein